MANGVAPEVLEGEIAAIANDIDEELQFSTFEQEVDVLPDIIECLEKLDKLRREYVAKTVTLSKRDEDFDLESTDKRNHDLTNKIKELRLQKRDIAKIKRQNEEAVAQREVELKKMKELRKKKHWKKLKRKLKRLKRKKWL